MYDILNTVIGRLNILVETKTILKIIIKHGTPIIILRYNTNASG
jgi:hypothetical protein